MDEDTGSVPVSHELLHLESSVSSPGLPLKSLLITKGAKKAFAAPKPVKISRVDTSSILNRAKTFLGQVKESGPKEKEEESSCDLVTETEDSQELEDEERQQQEVELNFVLYPKTTCKTGSNLDKVTQLLEEENKDSEDSSSDTDESESESSDQESYDSHGDRRRELSGGKVSQLKHPRVCLEITESCEDQGQPSSS